MIQLPSIMEALDMLNVRPNQTAQRPVLIQLLQSCLSLNEQLLAWNKKLSNEVPGQLYWTTLSVAENPADNSVLGRIFLFALQFSSWRIAQVLIFYWSMLVLLYRTIQDIQKKLERDVTSGTTIENDSGLQDSDRSELELCSEYSYPSIDQIALLANNICQSFEFCYRSENGTLGLQSTAFPLWVAQSFYESQSDRDREREWCSNLGNMTAPDSRFDLYIKRLSSDS
jgi:hypothetical protein